MQWERITKEELVTLIQESIAGISPELKEKFDKIKVPAYEIDCQYNNSGIKEKIFVVAKFETRLIIYDDVEDEFGIADMNSNSILTNWVLLGELEYALLNINKKEIFGTSNLSQPC